MAKRNVASEMAMDLCINERGRGAGGLARLPPVRLRQHSWLSIALLLFIFLVDAKVHSHLTCHVSLCDGPRLVLLSFGLVAPTCFIDIWPRLVLLTFGPDLFYLLSAPTCFIYFWPRSV